MQVSILNAENALFMQWVDHASVLGELWAKGTAARAASQGRQPQQEAQQEALAGSAPAKAAPAVPTARCQAALLRPRRVL